MRTAVMVVAALLGACATTDSVTSPYLDRDGANISYQYGNFCGAGVPTLTGSPAERIAHLRALSPVDDIDRACKAHDLCYERNGHDNPACDVMAAQLLKVDVADPDAPLMFGQLAESLPAFFNPTPEQKAGQQCLNLANEISSALFLYKNAGRGVAGVVGAPLAGFDAAMKLTIGQANYRTYGFPPQPGHCFANADAERLAIRNACASYASAQQRAGQPASACSASVLWE